MKVLSFLDYFFCYRSANREVSVKNYFFFLLMKILWLDESGWASLPWAPRTGCWGIIAKAEIQTGHEEEGLHWGIGQTQEQVPWRGGDVPHLRVFKRLWGPSRTGFNTGSALRGLDCYRGVGPFQLNCAKLHEAKGTEDSFSTSLLMVSQQWDAVPGQVQQVNGIYGRCRTQDGAIYLYRTGQSKMSVFTEEI